MSVRSALKMIVPENVKLCIVELRRVLLSLSNSLRIFFGIYKNKAVEDWKLRGKERSDLTDVQIDGYEKMHKEWHSYIDEMIQDMGSCFKRHREEKGAYHFLDYACGTGRYIEPIVELGDVHYVGVDISNTILDNYTKKKFPDLDFYTFDFAKDDIAVVNFVKEHLGYFDGACINSAIQYVQYNEVDRLLERIYQMLKPGGLFYFQFPTPKDFWDIRANIDYIRYTPEMIEKKFMSLGMSIEESYSVRYRTTFKKYRPGEENDQGYVIVAKRH